MKWPFLRPWRPLFGIGLPLLAIVVFFVLSTFSLLHLSTIQAHMRLEAPHNMLWVISQAQVASLRLSNTITEYTVGPVEADKLQQEYDVFLSRLNLLEEGPQRRQMETFGFADALDALKPELTELQSRIETLQPHDLSNIQRVEQLLAPYTDILGQAATKAMVAEWESIGGKLEDSREQLWQIIISLIGILLAGIILIFHALLAIRQAQERTRLLNQEKAFSQLLIGSSEENIIAVDLKHRCTVWNTAAEQLFQYPTEAALGSTLGDISSFFQVDRVQHAVAKALDGHTAELLDQPFFLDVQSNARYLDVRCFPLYENQQIIGSILFIFDVTERRATQREIAMHRDHLEELVRARTLELDAALDRERASAELYRNFGTMISHQFRTPLSIVDSALQRLIRRSDRLSAKEVQVRSRRARDAIQRLIRLIESTLDAARLDTGQVEIHSHPYDLVQLASSVCTQQSSMTPNRIILFSAPEHISPIVNCDPTHVEHILGNLIANAIKYSDARSPVSVSVRCDDEHVECIVRNQGALADASRNNPDMLFERYFRDENAKGHTGIGIGLYMARALARLQNGDVSLSPSLEGTVSFVLRLPRTNRQHMTAPCPMTESA